MDYGREYPSSSGGGSARYPQIDKQKFSKVKWTTAEDVISTAQKFVLHVFATQILHVGVYCVFFGVRFASRRLWKWFKRAFGRKIIRTLR